MADQRMTWRWQGVALRGLVAIVLGVLSILLPVATLLSLVALFGVFALFDGILALSIVGRVDKPHRWFVVVHGIASLAIGLLAMTWPEMTALVLLMFIAGWAVITGIMGILMATRLRGVVAGDWMIGLSGVLSVAFGVVLMLAPRSAAVALAVWLGAFAILYGIVLVATAIRHRHDAPFVAAA